VPQRIGLSVRRLSSGRGDRCDEYRSEEHRRASFSNPNDWS
jgi:hypothetical protein